MLLTRLPLAIRTFDLDVIAISGNVLPVRLACLIHAASVHPELGSNSKFNSRSKLHELNGTKEKTIVFLLDQ